MLFDDRLATVLRHRADGERAARTQFRQLLDLLGEPAPARDESLVAAAYLRLEALSELIPAREKARAVEEAGSRLRSPELVEWLAEAEPDISGAALASANLTIEEWAALIPELPIRARGFLRHRRDLPAETEHLLDRLGVRDRVLPEPDVLDLTELEPELATSQVEPEALAATPEPPAERSEDGIGALRRRIEAFTRSRTSGESSGPAPRLPLGESDDSAPKRPVTSFLFGTDVYGQIDWAEPEIAPMVVGMQFAAPATGPHTRSEIASAFANRTPIRTARAQLRGGEPIAGEWIVDAAPRFSRNDGRFEGFAGRFRRLPDKTGGAHESEADRVRQLLHELRTPVNAIQGFAEVIQQQLFGATPHEYRALAASIAGDAARILAGFDELDRLAKLEGGVIELDAGSSDFAALARRQVEQLQSVLSARVARLSARWPDGPAPVALASDEAEMLAWRLAATLASTTGAGETVALEMTRDAGQLAWQCDLPANLAAIDDIFSTENRQTGGAVNASLFGTGFALRLAKAEARAAGGALARVENRLVLTLPLLAASHKDASPVSANG